MSTGRPIGALARRAAGYRQTRPATLADAPALLDLYPAPLRSPPRGLRPHPGGPAHQLAHRLVELPPLVAVDGDGRSGLPDVRLRPLVARPGPGPRGRRRRLARTLALLRGHAALVAGLPRPPAALRWQAPPNSAALHHLADHLPLVSTTAIRPGEGWQARLVHLELLFEPARWTRRPPSKRWRRDGGGSYAVRIAVGVRVWGPAGGHRHRRVPPAAPARRRALTRRLLAARCSSAIARRPGGPHPEASVPSGAVPLLDALFPACVGYAPGCGSDAF